MPHDNLFASRRRNARRGGRGRAFTALELIAVVVVVAVLAGAGAVTYRKVISNADDGSALRNLDTLARAAQGAYVYAKGSERWGSAVAIAAADSSFRGDDGASAAVVLLADDGAGLTPATDPTSVSWATATQDGQPLLGLATVTLKGRCAFLVSAPRQVLRSWVAPPDTLVSCTGSWALNNWDADDEETTSTTTPAPNSTTTTPSTTTPPTTTTSPPQNPLLAAPQNVDAAVDGPESIEVTWNASSSPVTGYQIERFNPVGGIYETVGTVASSSSKFSDTGLTAGTTYTYRVLSYVGSSTSAPSQTASATAINPPAAPSITAVSFGNRSISIVYTVAASAQAPVSSVAAHRNGLVTSTSLNTANGSGYTYTYTLLTVGQSYSLTLRATNAAGFTTSEVSGPHVAVSRPGVPAGVTVAPTAAGSDKLVVSWGAVTGASGYYVERFNPTSGMFEAAGSTPSTQFTDSGLVAGASYTYRVKTFLGDMVSAASTIAVGTPIRAPIPPVITSVVTGDSSVTLTFDVAASAAAPVSAAAALNGSTVKSTSLPTVTGAGYTFTFSGLTPGQSYTLSVRLTNAVGSVSASETVTAVAMVGVPTLLKATVNGPESLLVSWAAPAGAPSGYQVERLNTLTGLYETVASVSGTSFVDTGLVAGSSYTYRVRAFDATMTSAASAAASMTAIAQPAAPTITAVSFGDNEITITYSVSYTPAAPISVTAGLRNGVAVSSDLATASGSGHTFTFGGLSAGQAYTFAVRASNAAGSATSGASGPHTAIQRPGVPSGLSVLPSASGADLLDVAWAGVVGAEGYYVERLNAVSGVYETVSTSSATTFTDTGLDAGTAYTYRVKAYTSTLASAASPSVSGIPIAAPATPTITAVSTSGDTATITFSVTSTASAPIASTSALLDGTVVSSALPTSTGTGLTYTFTGLSAGTTYTVAVRATNAVGTSTGSSTVTPPALPGAPDSLTASTASSTSIDLTWSEATGIVTGYQIERLNTISGLYETAAIVATTSFTDTALTSGVTYTYRVKAYNDTGSGAASNTASANTVGVPDAPSITASTPNADGTVTVSFTAPSANGGTITDYRVGYSTVSAAEASASPTVHADNESGVAAADSTITVTGLNAGTTYFFAVSAANSAGWGAWSSTATNVAWTPANDIASVQNWLDADTAASFNAESGDVAAWRPRLSRNTASVLNGTGLSLPGTSGVMATAPDSAALDITGQLDLIAQITPTSWRPATQQYIVSKYNTSSQRSYALTLMSSGALWVGVSNNGTNATGSTSTATIDLAPGTTQWIRALVTPGTDVKFFTSTDGTTWTQLGTSVALGSVTSLFVSTARLTIGDYDNTSLPFSGIVGRAQVWSGSSTAGGTKAFDANFAAAPNYAATLTESSSNAATVTLPSTTGFTQATASARPQRVPAARNGRAAVTFDGNDLVSWASDVWSDSNYVVCTALQPTSGSFFGSSNSIFAVSSVQYRPVSPILAYTGPSSASVYCFTGTSSPNTAATTAFANGAQLATSANASTFTTRCLGCGGAMAASMVGSFYEVVTVSGAFVDQPFSRVRLEGYLAHRWGLAGSLPAGHLYKNAPPALDAAVPRVVPPAPTITAAAPSNTSGQINVTFSAADNGGSTIADFDFEYSTNPSFAAGTGTFAENGSSRLLTQTITGLVDGTTYYFRVRAENASGSGSWSAPSAGAVPRAVPSTPAAPTLTAVGLAVEATWVAPASNGSAIVDYDLMYYTHPMTAAGLRPAMQSNTMIVADSNVLTPAADIDIVVRASANDWSTTTPQTLVAKRSDAGSNFGYQFRTANSSTPSLQLLVGNTSTTLTTYTATVAAPLTDGTSYWLRATRVAATATVAFYYAPDSVSVPTVWTQIGTSITSGPTGAIFNDSNTLTFGAGRTATTVFEAFPGTIYRAIVRSGIDGTAAVDADFTGRTPGTASFTESSANAFTVTELILNIAGSGVLVENGTSTALTQTISGLTANLPVYVRVRAENGAGSSAWSSSSLAATPFDVPASPSSLVATVDTASEIDLSWSAASGVVTGYQVEVYNPATTLWESLATTASTSYTVTSLTAGTSYSFRVKAYNAAGSSAASNTATQTAVNAPSAPSITAVTFGDGQITVTYAVVASAAGPVSTVSALLDGAVVSSALETDAGTGYTYTYTGLTPGSSYTLMLRAANPVGTSDSTNSGPHTAVAAPNAPTALTISTVVGSDSSVQLAWTAAAAKTGATITGYRVERLNTTSGLYELTGTTAPATTSYTDTGLSPTVTYTYRVWTYTTYLDSASAAGPVSGSPLGLPTAPTSLSVSASGATSLALSWTASTGTVTGYYVERLNTVSGLYEQMAITASTTFNDTGLAAGTSYTYRVKGYNDSGASDASNTASATTFTTPAAPTSMVAAAGASPESQVSLSWSPPPTDGGAAVTDYQVRAYVSGVEIGGSPKLVGSATTSYVYTGLSSATAYTFKVAAINSIGVGALSSASNSVTTTSTVAYSNGALDAAWAPHDDGTGVGPVGGGIFAMLRQPDGKYIVGGAFTSYAGLPFVRIARVNADGTLDTTFNPGSGANDSIQSMALQSDGKIVIAGLFTTVNGTSVNRLARLNTDGSLDTTFNVGTGASAGINAVALQPDGKVLIGGAFTTYNGTGRTYIARVNSDGSLDTTFNPGSGTSLAVNALAVQSDGKVVVGGAFTTYNGTARNYIARANADGSLDTTFNPGTGANAVLNALLIQPDGKILIAGAFSTYNGSSRSRLARVNADGTLDTTFNTGSGPSSTVNSLALQADGKVVIGGSFASVNGQTRTRLARVGADGAVDTTFVTTVGANNSVFAIAVNPSGSIVIAGSFTAFSGSHAVRLAQVSSTAVLDTAFARLVSANNSILDFAIQPDGKIVVTGSLTAVGAVSRPYLARLNADGTLDTTFNPGTGPANTVNEVVLLPNGQILIAGNFTSYNGTSIVRVARVNADGTLDTSFTTGTGPASSVTAMEVQSDGKIMIGGQFTTYAGTSRPRLARLNADGTLDTTFNPGTGANNTVSELAIQPDGKIVIVGSFTSYNGTARNYIARVDSSGAIEAAFNPAPGNTVSTVVLLSSGKMYVGGTFQSLSATPINLVARLNADGTRDSTFLPNFTTVTGSVLGLVEQDDGSIIIGGDFTGSVSSTGVSRSFLARLSSTGTLDSSFDAGPVVGTSISKVGFSSTKRLLAGGTFTSVNGHQRSYLAQFGPLSTPTRPRVTSATFAEGSGTLTWSAPTTSGSSAVTGYVVEYKLSTDSTWSSINVGNVTSATIALPAAGTYQVRVRGQNVVGAGWWSLPAQVVSS